jgi:hypothetical protein
MTPLVHRENWRCDENKKARALFPLSPAVSFGLLTRLLSRLTHLYDRQAPLHNRNSHDGNFGAGSSRGSQDKRYVHVAHYTASSFP